MSRSSTARLRVWSMPSVDAAERKTLLCKALPDRPVVDGAENAHVERHGVAHDTAPDEIGVVLLDQRLGKGGEGKVRAAEKSRKAVERARVVARRPQPPFRSQPGAICPRRNASTETSRCGVRKRATISSAVYGRLSSVSSRTIRSSRATSPSMRSRITDASPGSGRIAGSGVPPCGESGCGWRCGGP